MTASLETWRVIGLIGAGLNVIGALLLVVVISPVESGTRP
jgi:hypothetical protein